MISNSSLPAVVGFSSRDFRYRLVATLISHNLGTDFTTDRRFLPQGEQISAASRSTTSKQCTLNRLIIEPGHELKESRLKSGNHAELE